MFSTKKKGALGAALALWLGVGFASFVHADATLVGEKTTDQLKFSGDMRLRQENFFNKSLNVVDRSRQRYRLRFGVTGTIQDITAAFRLASGTGEQVSTNQTFGNAFGEKGIFIDQAYLSWKAQEHIRLTGGRMANPFWRNYSSDIVWDDDVNPEGIAEQFDLPAGDRLALFANFAQMPIYEISGSSQDPWVFGNQIGTGIKLTEDTGIKAGFSYYGFINENKQVFQSTSAVYSTVIQEANTRVPGSALLAGAYQLTLYSLALDSHLLMLPLSVQGDFVRNVAPGSGRAGYVNHATTAINWGRLSEKRKTRKPGSLLTSIST